MQDVQRYAVSDNDIMRYLLRLDKGLVLLSAPTNCGKTRLIKSIKDKRPNTEMLSAEQFMEAVLQPLQTDGSNDLLKGLSAYRCICVEDLDWYKDRKATQLEFVRVLENLAKKAVVIVTGIELRCRLKTMLANLKEYTFFEKQAVEESWIYDSLLQKGIRDKIIALRNKDFAQAVWEALDMREGTVWLSQIKAAEELSLDGCRLLPEDMEILYLFENLVSLIFVQDGPIDLRMFLPFKKLQYLNIGGKTIPVGTTFLHLEALAELPDLQGLRIGDFIEADLLQLAGLPQLRELLVGWGNSVKNAAAIGKLKHLEILELYDIELENLDFVDDLSETTRLEFAGVTVKKPFALNKLTRFRQYTCEDMNIAGEEVPLFSNIPSGSKG